MRISKTAFTLFYILSITLLFQCISKIDLKTAEFMEITLYAKKAESIDCNYKTITFKDQGSINKIAGYISGEESPLYKCGYTGKIDFYKNKKKFETAEFNLDKQCSHIVFEKKRNISSFKLSSEGLKFFRELYFKNVKKNYRIIEED